MKLFDPNTQESVTNNTIEINPQNYVIIRIPSYMYVTIPFVEQWVEFITSYTGIIPIKTRTWQSRSSYITISGMSNRQDATSNYGTYDMHLWIESAKFEMLTSSEQNTIIATSMPTITTNESVYLLRASGLTSISTSDWYFYVQMDFKTGRTIKSKLDNWVPSFKTVTNRESVEIPANSQEAKEVGVSMKYYTVKPINE